MRKITADEVIRFAAANQHREFFTLTDQAPFRVKAEAGGIIYYPQTGKGRGSDRRWIEQYVEMFNGQQNYVTTPYVAAKMHSSSYFVSLVKEMLEGPPLGAPAETTVPAQPQAPPVKDIESELMAFLARSTKGDKAVRNAEFVAYFYGFRGSPFPTLQDTANADNLTRERPRGIINRDFREKATLEGLPCTAKAAALLQSLAPISASDYLDALRRQELIAGECSSAGLLRLFEDLGACADIRLFDQELDPANTAERIQSAEELFFLPEAIEAEVREKLRAIRVLPGQIGIANFHYVDEDLTDLTEQTRHLLRQLVETSPRFWTKRDGTSLWFLFEDRENALITNLLKACNVTAACPLNDLAEALFRGLKAATRQRPYPEPAMIEEYLAQSRYLDVHGGTVHFRKDVCVAVGLTPVQEAVRRILANFGSEGATFPAIEEALRQSTERFGDSSIKKAVMNSPIVWVTGERGEKTYRLLSYAQQELTVSADERRLEKYRELLRGVGELGTDETAQTKRRREHAYLSQFLFADSTQQPCAICHHVLPVQALVAAHKRPRWRCSQTERLDPRIVMPLCVFGCDYLYERNLVYVENGTVKSNPAAASLAGIKERVAALEGRPVLEKWAQGPDYFRKMEGASFS